MVVKVVDCLDKPLFEMKRKLCKCDRVPKSGLQALTVCEVLL